MTPIIRRATLADAASLAEFAERTFRDTFGADNTPEDLALHLAECFGLEQQSRELRDSAMTTLVATEAGEIVAYAQLRQGAPPSCVTGTAPIEIQRFYVATEWKGRGLAQTLMAEAFTVARAAGAATVWLGVWERNPRAIAFYGKFGYSDVGAHTFMLGTDRQTDRILAMSLATVGQ
jgi:ribosomal protein S18 acetylase RimI-like enzyme